MMAFLFSSSISTFRSSRWTIATWNADRAPSSSVTADPAS